MFEFMKIAFNMIGNLKNVAPLPLVASAALLLLACAQETCLTSPFDPETACLISEPCNMMSHAPSVEIAPDGTVYAMYYRDTTQLVEDGANKSIELVFDRFSITDPSEVEHSAFLSIDRTVGDYTQRVRPAYDPSIFLSGEKLICDFLGYEEETRICRRVYDTGTGVFEDRIDRCNVSYSLDGNKITCPLSTSGITKLYGDFGFGEAVSVTDHLNPVIDKEFVRGDDGYFYNVISSWCCPQSRPVIVRTLDGVDYDVVFVCPEFVYGSAEASIAIVGGEFYIQARSARPEDKSKAGTYIGKYSASGECLVKPYKLGDIESRMAMTVHNGKLYSFYNAGPNIVSPLGRVHRSRLRISEIDSSAQAVRSWDVTSRHGIQYFNVDEWKGRLYMTFVEDRFEHKVTQAKGNVAFCKLNI